MKHSNAMHKENDTYSTYRHKYEHNRCSATLDCDEPLPADRAFDDSCTLAVTRISTLFYTAEFQTTQAELWSMIKIFVSRGDTDTATRCTTDDCGASSFTQTPIPEKTTTRTKHINRALKVTRCSPLTARVQLRYTVHNILF